MSAGRVTVNDEPAVLGQRVDVSDRVAIDGKPCYTETAAAGSGRVIGVHKPADVVCTRHDPEGRPTIFELLPATARRWVMVGRLDLTTSGLVLFTDDGELAHRLTHPSYQIPRRYAVRVLGTPEAEVLAAMLAGVEVDGEMLRFDRIAASGGEGANRWFDCTLHTGRNREVRRLWEAHGLAVSRLMRVSYGVLSLPREVRPGLWFEVQGQPLTRLYESVGLEAPGALPEPPPVLPARRGRTVAGRKAPQPAGGRPVKQKAGERTARIEYMTPEQRLERPHRRHGRDGALPARPAPRSRDAAGGRGAGESGSDRTPPRGRSGPSSAGPRGRGPARTAPAEAGAGDGRRPPRPQRSRDEATTGGERGRGPARPRPAAGAGAGDGWRPPRPQRAREEGADSNERARGPARARPAAGGAVYERRPPRAGAEGASPPARRGPPRERAEGTGERWQPARTPRGRDEGGNPREKTAPAGPALYRGAAAKAPGERSPRGGSGAPRKAPSGAPRPRRPRPEN